MNILADALVFVAAYLGTVAADDEREDADCATLESIGAILSTASAEERQALHEAVNRAIALEGTRAVPRDEQLAAFRAFAESYLS